MLAKTRALFPFSLFPGGRGRIYKKTWLRPEAHLFFNVVSWLAILIVIAGGCYLASYGLAAVVVKIMPALERFFQAGVIVCSGGLTLVVVSALVLFLGGRRN